MTPVSSSPSPEADAAGGSARRGRDTLPPGTLLGDGYRIERLLGQGGFGAVYLATDLALQRPIALKEYLPLQFAGRGEGAALGLRDTNHGDAFRRGLHSFLREARLLAQFDHPSLVRVYRFWEENHTAYMAMPYLPGRTLQAARQQMQRPPDEDWLRESLLLPLLGALDTLHRADCLHRDVSPGNILLCDDGRVVLLDFGSARRVVAGMTMPLTAIVNPQYAAIEQYAESPSLPQGPWTDLYGLAAVAYHLLSGRPPVPATIRAVNEAAMPTMAEVAQSIGQTFPGLHYSPPLLAALDRALAVRPTDRPRSAQALRELVLQAHVLPDVTLEGPAAALPSEETITLFADAPGPAEATRAAPADAGTEAKEPAALDAAEEAAMRALIATALGDVADWPPLARQSPPRIEPVLTPTIPPRAAPPAAHPALAEFADRQPPAPPAPVSLRVVQDNGARGEERHEPRLDPAGAAPPVPAPPAVEASADTAAPSQSAESVRAPAEPPRPAGPAWQTTLPVVTRLPVREQAVASQPLSSAAPAAAEPAGPDTTPAMDGATAAQAATPSLAGDDVGTTLPTTPEPDLFVNDAPAAMPPPRTQRRRRLLAWASAAVAALAVAWLGWQSMGQEDAGERWASTSSSAAPDPAVRGAAPVPQPTPPTVAQPSPAAPVGDTPPPQQVAVAPASPPPTATPPSADELDTPAAEVAAPAAPAAVAARDQPREPRAEARRGTTTAAVAPSRTGTSGTGAAAGARKASAGTTRTSTQKASTARKPAVPARSTTQSTASSRDPRSVCGNRQNFSLLYCMRQQCKQPRFAGHARCVELRRSDSL